MAHSKATRTVSQTFAKRCQRTLLHLAARNLLVLGCVLPGTLTAQVVVDLEAFAPCERCDLQAMPIATIGDSTGPGTIDNAAPRLVAE